MASQVLLLSNVPQFKRLVNESARRREQSVSKPFSFYSTLKIAIWKPLVVARLSQRNHDVSIPTAGHYYATAGNHLGAICLNLPHLRPRNLLLNGFLYDIYCETIEGTLVIQ